MIRQKEVIREWIDETWDTSKMVITYVVTLLAWGALFYFVLV